MKCKFKNNESGVIEYRGKEYLCEKECDHQTRCCEGCDDEECNILCDIYALTNTCKRCQYCSQS